jgi:hypothetical protein
MLYGAYIEPAKKAGCQCILCTPIVRRTTTDFWQNQQLHITADSGNFKGGDYPQVVRKLGEALNIPLVDMTELTRNLYEKLTPQQTVYLHAWPSQNKASVDNTHTNIWGARVNACLCLNEVKKLEISGLSSHITGLDIKDALDMKKYLVSNPDYKAVVYTANLTKSLLWEEADGFSGTVFGDVGDSLSKENFVLEKCDGGVHIAVKNNSGKIASVSDGIAMYYKKVRTGKAFTLKATVHINDYFLNDQVSFGLMVRDDMYIDKVTADLLGDYVAAAPLLLTKKEKSRCCFARKSGELVMGGTCTREYKPGDTVRLCIQSGSDGYACTFGDEETVTVGFDFPLTSIDADYVYVGMFAARNADVTFFDISLETEED